jgi:hypothetical protein
VFASPFFLKNVVFASGGGDGIGASAYEDILSAREGGDEDHPADEGGAKTRASAASLEQILCLNKYRRF